MVIAMKYYVDLNKTLGQVLYLVGVKKWVRYEDDKPTSEILGVKVDVAAMVPQPVTVSVKILDGEVEKYKKILDSSSNQLLKVELVNGVGTYYSFNGRAGLSIVADDVKALS